MRVILTGGGTGGHIYPALAIGDKIKEREPDSEILYIGNEMGIEKEIVPAAGYEFRMVPARWLERRKNKLDYFCQLGLTGAVTCRGTAKALSIMRKFRPDAVIGTGGFVCVPVVLAGKMYGARTFIHEQNAFPGAANRLLSKYADRIFLGFSEGGAYFGCPEKLIYTGNPVRKDFLGITREEARKLLNIPEDSFTVFSFGGSMGSETINSIAVRIIKEVNGKEGWNVITGTGSAHYDEIVEELKMSGIETADNIDIRPYIRDMHVCMNGADVVIGRAGALSVAETTICGRAAVFVPYPEATGNHQYFNAKAIAEAGGAILAEEKDLDVDEVAEKIKALKDNREELEAMSRASLSCSPKGATDKIYEEIKETLQK